MNSLWRVGKEEYERDDKKRHAAGQAVLGACEICSTVRQRRPRILAWEHRAGWGRPAGGGEGFEEAVSSTSPGPYVVANGGG